MARTNLTADTLGDLDGGVVRLLIDAEIQKAIADLDDRGQEDKLPRKVMIQLTLGLSDTGLTIAQVATEAKLPPRKSRGTVSKLRADAGKHTLVFESENPSNPDQPVMEFDDDKPKKKSKE